MKRNYLVVPGQKLRISITGPSGSGKQLVASKLIKMFQADGLFASGFEHDQTTGIVEITCPTPAEAREVYLSTLDQQQAMTLRGHLDALGFEL